MLVAIAPFHLLYSQEARQISLWTLLILTSSASLLRALRRPTVKSWVIYAVAVVAGMYTQILFVCVVVSHGAYVAWSWIRRSAEDAERSTKGLTGWSLACSAALLAFVPWALVVVREWRAAMEDSRWLAQPVERLYWAGTVLSGIGTIFVDLTGLAVRPAAPSLASLIETPTLVLVLLAPAVVLGLAVYGTYCVARETPPRVWSFIVALGSPPILLLIARDLMFDSRASTAIRYFAPLLIALELAMAYLLTTRLTGCGILARGWRVAAVAMDAAALVSCALIVWAPTWWHKGTGMQNHRIAAEINSQARPLVLSGVGGGALVELVSLATLLRSDVAVRLVPNGEVTSLDPSDAPVYVFEGRPGFVRRLMAEGAVVGEPVGTEGRLWRVAPAP